MSPCRACALRLIQESLGGGGTWWGRIYLSTPIPTGAFAANGQTVTAPGDVSQKGYVLLDLLARYDLSPNVSVTATNVLDKSHFPNIGFFNSGWSGQPRRISGNMRWHF